MSYTTLENSVQDGAPAYRFLFVVGAVEYRFTTEQMIVGDSNGTYTPAPINASEISQTNELAKDPIKLDFPRDNAFAALFVGGVPEDVTSVTIYRLHVNDDQMDYQTAWKGRVTSASATGDTVTIQCENIFTSMRRPGLRARYQRQCRHPLYSTGCGLTDSDWAISGTVVSVSGSTVVIDELDSNAAPDSSYDSTTEDADFYEGGILETADGYRRYIIAQSGKTLTMIRPLPELTDEVNGSAGLALVTLYPGCDHFRATCKNKFNNLDNFGGFPWIPNKNPFGNDVTGSIA